MLLYEYQYMGGKMSLISVKNLTFRYDGSIDNVF